MKKVSLDVWIQSIGMLSIVASLIFVGLEMRQTQQIAIAGQVQARAQMQVDRLLTGLEGKLDIYRLWNTNNFKYDELHEDEKIAAEAAHNWKQTMLENNFSNIVRDYLRKSIGSKPKVEYKTGMTSASFALLDNRSQVFKSI